MRSRTWKHIFGIILILAIVIFAWTLIGATLYAPDGIPAPAPPQTAFGENIATTSLPSRLIIPALNINANVQDLGINSIGNMQAPDNFTDVGWYKYGTVPGQLGSAVIDGHVDNGLGLAGVFKQLDSIKVGDDVYVQTIGGQKLHFVVSDIEIYPYQNVPLNTVFAQSDTARLNLITCDGTWVNGKDTYDERLVVYTTYVGGT